MMVLVVPGLTVGLCLAFTVKQLGGSILYTLMVVLKAFAIVPDHYVEAWQQAACNMQEQYPSYTPRSTLFQITPNVVPVILHWNKAPTPHNQRVFTVSRRLAYAIGGEVLTESIPSLVLQGLNNYYSPGGWSTIAIVSCAASSFMISRLVYACVGNVRNAPELPMALAAFVRASGDKGLRIPDGSYV